MSVSKKIAPTFGKNFNRSFTPPFTPASYYSILEYGVLSDYEFETTITCKETV